MPTKEWVKLHGCLIAEERIRELVGKSPTEKSMHANLMIEYWAAIQFLAQFENNARIQNNGTMLEVVFKDIKTQVKEINESDVEYEYLKPHNPTKFS